MIDIGANLGYFSLLWAAAPGNTCFSFEPSPRNAELFRHNVTSNGLGSQIKVFPLAAGKEAGSRGFNAGAVDQTGWGGFSAGDSSPDIFVEVVRIDEVLAGLKEIALLKIDTEGADTWALMGCERLLRSRSVRLVWFEQNKPRMRRLGIGDGEAEAFLRSVGYKARPESDPSRDVVDWSASPMSRGQS